jgi:TetR/AcrR family transcriptional regulator
VRTVPAEMAKKLASAASVFAENGFEAARIDDVARAAGIPRATLYYYFAGKEELVGFLLRSLLDEVATQVRAAAETATDDVERLREVLRVQLSVIAANPDTARLLLANIGRAGRLTDIALAVDQAFHTPVREILASGAAAGALRPVDVERTASAVFGAVVLVGLREIILHGRLEPSEVLPTVERVVLDGLVRPR